MTQLNLFDTGEPEEPNKDYLPPHFKTIGGGNYNDFLEVERNYDNTIVSLSSMDEVDKRLINGKRIPIFKLSISRYRISDLNSIDDLPLVKRLLYSFDSDTKEWIHKPVHNFKVNQMLHNIYDSLNERLNHV